MRTTGLPNHFIGPSSTEHPPDKGPVVKRVLPHPGRREAHDSASDISPPMDLTDTRKSSAISRQHSTATFSEQLKRLLSDKVCSLYGEGRLKRLTDLVVNISGSVDPALASGPPTADVLADWIAIQQYV